MPCQPRMRGCAASCLHRQLVESYRDARRAEELARETATGHHRGDLVIYRETTTMINFKAWLVGSTAKRYAA